MKSVLWRYRYLLLLLVFIPITLMNVADMRSRSIQTGIPPIFDAPSDSFLARDSHMHYALAGISAAIFLVLTMYLFDRARITFVQVLAAGLFTGIVCIPLVFALQWVADESTRQTVWGDRNSVLLHYVLEAIAYSYRASNQAAESIEVQLLGYIFGVGLVEEITKVLPVLYLLRRNSKLPEVDARVIGFISGIGFGVAEGLLYSQRYYNGVSGPTMYAVRFLSLVGFHGVATATAASLVVRHNLSPALEWRYLARLVWVILPVMLMHAIYDTFCSRNEPGWALLIVFLLFGLMTYQVESSRRKMAHFPILPSSL